MDDVPNNFEIIRTLYLLANLTFLDEHIDHNFVLCIFQKIHEKLGLAEKRF